MDARTPISASFTASRMSPSVDAPAGMSMVAVARSAFCAKPVIVPVSSAVTVPNRNVMEPVPTSSAGPAKAPDATD